MSPPTFGRRPLVLFLDIAGEFALHGRFTPGVPGIKVACFQIECAYPADRKLLARAKAFATNRGGTFETVQTVSPLFLVRIPHSRRWDRHSYISVAASLFVALSGAEDADAER